MKNGTQNNFDTFKKVSLQIAPPHESFNILEKQEHTNNSANIYHQSICEEAPCQFPLIKKYNFNLHGKRKDLPDKPPTIHIIDDVKSSIEGKIAGENFPKSNKFYSNTVKIKENHPKNLDKNNMSAIVYIDHDINIHQSDLIRSNSVPVDTLATLFDKNDLNENSMYKKKWIFCKICKLGKENYLHIIINLLKDSLQKKLWLLWIILREIYPQMILKRLCIKKLWTLLLNQRIISIQNPYVKILK